MSRFVDGLHYLSRAGVVASICVIVGHIFARSARSRMIGYLCAYLILLLTITLIPVSGQVYVSLDPAQFVRDGISKQYLLNIGINVLLFVPWGVFLKLLVRNLNAASWVTSGVLVGCTIEFLQYITHSGRSVDSADVLWDASGTFLGVWAAEVALRWLAARAHQIALADENIPLDA